MRVTNIIREKISLVVEKKVSAAVNELYAERREIEKEALAQLKAIREEANERARAVLATIPGAWFSSYGHVENYFVQTAALKMPQDEELDKKTSELRERAKEVKMDMEIRCQLEKDADAFFKALEDIKL